MAFTPTCVDEAMRGGDYAPSEKLPLPQGIRGSKSMVMMPPDTAWSVAVPARLTIAAPVENALSDLITE
jgi:hypothetical protein